MHILTILGSPRRHGNTARALAVVEDALRAAGHEVESLAMIDYNVQGCKECFACNENKIELCSIADDGNSLFRRMAAADLVLIAAPVFCWGFPAQLKGLIDRLYCMMDLEGRRPDVPRLYDKRIALLMTGGGDEIDNADLVIRGFQHMMAFLHSRLVGHLYLGNCSNKPEPLSEEAQAQAVAFAKKLVTG
jgi:multimeric flavodoxin WrbA